MRSTRPHLQPEPAVLHRLRVDRLVTENRDAQQRLARRQALVDAVPASMRHKHAHGWVAQHGRLRHPAQHEHVVWGAAGRQVLLLHLLQPGSERRQAASAAASERDSKHCRR